MKCLITHARANKLAIDVNLLSTQNRWTRSRVPNNGTYDTKDQVVSHVFSLLVPRNATLIGSVLDNLAIYSRVLPIAAEDIDPMFRTYCLLHILSCIRFISSLLSISSFHKKQKPPDNV